MFFFIFLLFSVSTCFAQSFPPDSVWTFSYDDGGDEYFYDAIEVSDGYLLCGEAREWNAMAGEALLVKIDRNGELVWSRRYDDDNQSRFRHFFASTDLPPDELSVITDVVTSAGDPITIRQRLFHSDGEPYTFDGEVCGVAPWQGYTKAAADVEWPQSVNFGLHQELLTSHYTLRDTLSQFYLGEGDTHDCFALHEFGQYEITDGFSQSGLWFTCVCGNTIAESPGMTTQGFFGISGTHEYFEFGGDNDDEFRAVLIRVGSLPIWAFGWSKSFTNGGSDLWIVGATTNHPDPPIIRHYGGLSNEDAVEAFLASDSGFIVAGNFSSEDIEFEQSDFWLLKVDDDGDSVWSVVKGGDEADRCEGMIETENGYLLFGSSQSFAVPGWDGCAMLLAYVPDIAATPGSLNFGAVQVGDSSTRTLGLINTGSNVLTVNSIERTENYFSDFIGPATVEIGDTLRVNIMFAPQSGGTHVDTLLIMSDALSGVKTVRCLGAGTGTAADDGLLVPTEFALHPPYPNPFNPTTTIAFDVPRSANVELSLFDVQGRMIETLLDENLTAGSYSQEWTCSTCAAGVYFARLRTSEFQGIQKLVLIK